MEIPDNWILKVTEENKEYIDNWRASGTIKAINGDLGYIIALCHGYWLKSTDIRIKEYQLINYNFFRRFIALDPISIQQKLELFKL